MIEDIIKRFTILIYIKIISFNIIIFISTKIVFKDRKT